MVGICLPSQYMLRKARMNLFFHPPKLGDPPPTTYGRAHTSFVPLTAAAVTVTTQYAAVAYRSPSSSIIVLWNALYQAGGGGGSLPGQDCVRFYIAEVGGLCIVPCVGSYTAEADDSVPSPVFGLYSRGGRLCAVPCVRFI